MREFNIGTDPADIGRKIYKRKVHSFNPGVTVLVGCNGSSKTTLINTVAGLLRKDNIPCYKYNNLSFSTHSISSAMSRGDNVGAAMRFTSSEGENIYINICDIVGDIKEFLQTGMANNLRRASISQDKKDKLSKSKERWILFDAIDSGFSIDNIIDTKENLFKPILKDSKDLGLDTYIIVSANEYEMCIGESTYGVQDAKYIDIKSYDDYKSYILKTRKYKDKCIDNARQQGGEDE